MSSQNLSRVNYFTNQFLRTQDFVDEQQYHLSMLRRHLVSHHIWGIVQGLTFSVDENSFCVQPGIAIDGYGRILVLPEKQAISMQAFAEKGAKTLDVWLMYHLSGSDQAPPGYSGCGEESRRFYRWQEIPRLRLTVPDPRFPNRREPKGVPDGDLKFDGTQSPPDDPAQAWPVFLGQVMHDPDNTDGVLSVNLDNRPYAGSRAQQIMSPSGRAWMQVGSESPAIPRQFAIFVKNEDERSPLPRLEILKPPQLQSEENPDHTDAWQIALRGETALHGSLKIEKGAVQWETPVEEADVTQACPWQLYRVKKSVQDTTKTPGNTPIDSDQHELRIEIDGNSGGKNQFVVGYWSDEDGAFHKCFTVDDNCAVTVHGNLIVEGKLQGVSQLRPPVLSEAVKQSASAGLTTGIGAANEFLEKADQLSFSAANVAQLLFRQAAGETLQVINTEFDNFDDGEKAQVANETAQLFLTFTPAVIDDAASDAFMDTFLKLAMAKASKKILRNLFEQIENNTQWIDEMITTLDSPDFPKIIKEIRDKF